MMECYGYEKGGEKQMKLRYIPALALLAIVGTLAYFAATGPTLENQWKGCPNVTWHVPQVPPFQAELQYKFQVDRAIAQIAKRVPVVTTASWTDQNVLSKETLLASSLPRDVHESEVQYKGGDQNIMW